MRGDDAIDWHVRRASCSERPLHLIEETSGQWSRYWMVGVGFRTSRWWNGRPWLSVPFLVLDDYGNGFPNHLIPEGRKKGPLITRIMRPPTSLRPRIFNLPGFFANLLWSKFMINCIYSRFRVQILVVLDMILHTKKLLSMFPGTSHPYSFTVPTGCWHRFRFLAMPPEF
jgi:hypothetical protein